MPVERAIIPVVQVIERDAVEGPRLDGGRHVERRTVHAVYQQIRFRCDDECNVDVLPGRRRFGAAIVPEAQHAEEVALIGPSEKAVDLVHGNGDGCADWFEDAVLDEVREVERRSKIEFWFEFQTKRPKQDLTDSPEQRGMCVQLRLGERLKIDEGELLALVW